MIAEMTDNFIPANLRPQFLADVSYYLAQAIFRLAKAGGIPPEGKQKAGEEAIGLARKALELRTQLYGTEGADVAGAMGTLADVLNCFNDVEDDEVLRLYEQASAIYRRVEGISSMNAATMVYQLGNAYIHRAVRAQTVNDLDRSMANMELALPRCREAARIYRDNNHVDNADKALRTINKVEEYIQLIEVAKAVAAAGTTRA